MTQVTKIPGRIESAATGNVVTGANSILDDGKGKKQNVINSEVDAELVRLEQNKQNNLTFDNVPTEDSDNPVKSGGVYAADKALSDAIEAILLLIPSAASSLNQLADKNFVNSSISTATATPRGTYNLVSDLDLTTDATRDAIAEKLGEVIDVADMNDYAFVQVPVSDDDPTEIERTERYKFNGNVWIYEYTLNTSGFTAAQWDAINSGITTALVAKLDGLPTAEALELALGAITQNIQNISAVIPTDATAQNQLADKAYVLTQILLATPSFNGQFTTLTQLEEVEEPKAGDLGIVRTKDTDGHDVFTFYQYLDDQWNEYYVLSYHPQDKPATTGWLGDYPYNGMGRVELPMNMVEGWPDNTWIYLPKNDVVYLLYSWRLQLYAVYNTDTQEGLGLDDNLVVQPANYDIADIEELVEGHYLPFTEDGGVWTITKPDGTIITSTELNNTSIYNFNDPTHHGVNVLTQAMINRPNTIYVIQHDYDLNGATITVPSNCVLDFQGGSLNNGKVISNNTVLIGKYNENTLYGVFYNEHGNALTYNKKPFIGINAVVEHGDIANVAGTPFRTYGVAESMVVTENYILFLMAQINNGYGNVVLYDRNYNYLGEAIVPNFGHCNGATLCEDRIYVVQAEDNLNKVFYLPVDDLVNACINNMSITANELTIEGTDAAMTIDYDSDTETFAVFSGTHIPQGAGKQAFLRIYDKNFNLLSSFDNNLTNQIATEYLKSEDLTTKIGTFGDIVFHNGVVIVGYWYKDSDGYYGERQQALYFQIDATTGYVTNFLGDIEGCSPRTEPEGLCKDPLDDDVLWASINAKVSFTNDRQGFYIYKLSFSKKLTPRALFRPTVYEKNCLHTLHELTAVYVDNSPSNTKYSTGNELSPFKTLTQALMMTGSKNITICLKGHSGNDNLPYRIGNVRFLGIHLEFSGYGDEKPILRGDYYFNDSYLYLQNVHIECAVTPMFQLVDSTVCLINTYSTTILEQDLTYPYFTPVLFQLRRDSVADIRDNNIIEGLATGFDVGTGSKISNIDSLTIKNVRWGIFSRTFNNTLDRNVINNIHIEADTLANPRKIGFVGTEGNGRVPHATSIYVPSNITTYADLKTYLDGILGTADISGDERNRENIDIIIGRDLGELIGGIYIYERNGNGLCLNTKQDTANHVNVKGYTRGTRVFDSVMNKPLYVQAFDVSSGSDTWVDSNGFSAAPTRGTTTNRPKGIGAVNGLLDPSRDIGFHYFDTTIKKPVYASAIANDGTVTWVDATGATV